MQEYAEGQDPNKPEATPATQADLEADDRRLRALFASEGQRYLDHVLRANAPENLHPYPEHRVNNPSDFQRASSSWQATRRT